LVIVSIYTTTFVERANAPVTPGRGSRRELKLSTGTQVTFIANLVAHIPAIVTLGPSQASGSQTFLAVAIRSGLSLNFKLGFHHLDSHLLMGITDTFTGNGPSSCQRKGALGVSIRTSHATGIKGTTGPSSLPGTHSSGTKGTLPIVCDGEGVITSVLDLPADLIVLASAEVRQPVAALIIKVRPIIRVTAPTGRVAMVVPGSTKTVVVAGTTKTVAGTGVITAITD